MAQVETAKRSSPLVLEEFSQETTKETQAVSARRHFLNIVMVINLLESYRDTGFEYALVGSLPLEAGVGGKYAPVCRDGRIRDLDILVLQDPNGIFPLLKEKFGKLREKKVLACVVDLKIVKPVGYRNAKQLSPALRRDAEGGFSLVFRDIEIELPKKATAIERGTITGPDGSVVEFNTHAPEALFAFYEKHFGYLRPKDKEHMQSARKLARRNGINIQDEALAKAFSAFRQCSKEKYPWAVRSHLVLVKVYARLAHSPFGEWVEKSGIKQAFVR